MTHTLTSEYFTLIGSLSTCLDGQKVLERCRIFTTFYQIADLKVRDDIVKSLICCMDYNLYVFLKLIRHFSDSHPRIILSKILTCGTTDLRLFATLHTRFLLRNQVDDFSEWVVPLLVTQLYDLDESVHNCAVQVLDEAFDTEENLNAAVMLSPDLSHLVSVADSLLLRFISIPRGFELLSLENDYVAKEIDHWFETGNLNYVARLEYELSFALSKPIMIKSTNLEQPIQFTFFGKTIDQEQLNTWYV
jgi:rapamycin-insensitive companion of mTOR